jgi:hypothetical protein
MNPNFIHSVTEPVRVAAMLLTRNRQVLGLNLGRDTGCLIIIYLF